MNTLHLLGEAAVQRDLHRARVVLASGGHLRADRRTALCEHLAWIAGLVDPSRPVVGDAAVRLRDSAVVFAELPERAYRVEVLGAIGSLHRVVRRHQGWISAHVLPELGDQVPWLFDGVARHRGAGLSVSADVRLAGRERAETYRRRCLELWGPALFERAT